MIWLELRLLVLLQVLGEHAMDLLTMACHVVLSASLGAEVAEH